MYITNHFLFQTTWIITFSDCWLKRNHNNFYHVDQQIANCTSHVIHIRFDQFTIRGYRFVSILQFNLLNISIIIQHSNTPPLPVQYISNQKFMSTKRENPYYIYICAEIDSVDCVLWWPNRTHGMCDPELYFEQRGWWFIGGSRPAYSLSTNLTGVSFLCIQISDRVLHALLETVFIRCLNGCARWWILCNRVCPWDASMQSIHGVSSWNVGFRHQRARLFVYLWIRIVD